MFLPLLAAYNPSNVRVSQTGLNSLLVSWAYHPSLPAVTGFLISYYQDGGNSGSVTAGQNDSNVTISGLITGSTYSIKIVANSSTLPSNPSTARFTLCMFVIMY